MSKGYVTIPVGYSRVDNEPLELNTRFDSVAAASEYALTNPTAYPGQILSVRGNPITIYVIEEDKSLTLWGSYQAKHDIVSSPMTLTFRSSKKPTVKVIDSNGYECICEVQYLSDNKVKISWNGDLTGTIYLD